MALAKDFRFESQRLRFRGIQERDAETIVRWRSNPGNYQCFLNARPITLEEHTKWFGRYLDDHSRFDFLIEDNKGNPIGTCGLSNITNESCEISYMIGDEEARGKGYATEAVKALVEIAFNELGVACIDARILSQNIASTRVVSKCGFDEVEKVFKLRRE